MRGMCWNPASCNPVKLLRPSVYTVEPGATFCFKESEQGCVLEIRDYGHPSASSGAAAFLHCNQDQCRFSTLQLPTPAQASRGATNPRIINFYFAVQWLACQIDHCAPEFMEHHPGRLITSQGELALQE